MRVFIGARVFDGARLREGLALVTNGASVVALAPHAERPAGEEIDLGGGVLAPGFVDWQVNGGGGSLFNAAPAPKTIAAIAAAHRRFGTTALAPTVVTDAPAVLTAALAAGRLPLAGSLGLHVEGPFIDVEARGAHPAAPIRAMTDADVRALIEARVRVVTLSPAAASPAQIRRLASAGIVVSLGHTQASAEAARAAFDAGARAATHLFNAMSPLQSRAPGVAGAALADARVTVGLIADGVHVEATAARVALRCKGAARLSLVSDAMPPAAGGPDAFRLGGREVTRRGDRLTLDDGALAGAAITMHDALRFAVRRLGASLEEALTMATSTPARLLGVADRHGVLKPGARADLVHLADDLSLQGVWFGGEAVER